MRYDDWRDAPGPYFRVNYGNGQVSAVFYGAGSRKRADDYRARVASGTPYVETYHVDGGEWFHAR